MRADRGKWSQPGVPHKGWHCVGTEDRGEPTHTCEMCEFAQCRYIHFMGHPEYPDVLGVGCICAEHMERDYAAPREREKQMQRRTSRRARWLLRQWRTSAKGNPFLNTDGFNIVIHPAGSGWTFRISERDGSLTWPAKRRYPSEHEAKLGAFDMMMFLKDRGFGVGAPILGRF